PALVSHSFPTRRSSDLGHWVAVPTSYGSTLSPPCARIDLMKEIVGLDVTKMYPAGAAPDKELTDKWNWDFFSEAAGKAKKAGHRSEEHTSELQSRENLV